MFSTLRDRLQKGRFARNVATMLAGNFSAQIIAFLAAPIITRLYLPEDFGVMTLIMSYTGIFSIISCMRFEQPIVIEPDSANALNIFALCIIIASSFSLLLCGIVFFFDEQIASLINLQQNSSYLWFIPAGVFVFGLSYALSSWNARRKNFPLLSFCRTFGALLTASTKIVLGTLFLSSGLWLLFGNILGIFGPAVILLVFLLGKDQILRNSVNRQAIKNMAYKYKKFPTYHTATGLLNSLSQNLPVILFAFYFSPAVVGFYGLANSILRKPIELVAGSMSKVLLQKTAETHAAGQSLKENFLKVTKGLIAVGIIPFCILGLAGETLFSFLFGENWITAGLYAQLLAPWLFILLINLPATQVIIVKQKLRFNLFFNMVNIILRLIIIVVSAIIFSDPVTTIALFSASGVIINLFYINYAYKLTTE